MKSVSSHPSTHSAESWRKNCSIHSRMALSFVTSWLKRIKQRIIVFFPVLHFCLHSKAIVDCGARGKPRLLDRCSQACCIAVEPFSAQWMCQLEPQIDLKTECVCLIVAMSVHILMTTHAGTYAAKTSPSSVHNRFTNKDLSMLIYFSSHTQNHLISDENSKLMQTFY